MLGPARSKPFFLFVAFLDGDVALEDLLDIGAEAGKVQRPPGGKLLIQPLARHAEVRKDTALRFRAFGVLRAICRSARRAPTRAFSVRRWWSRNESGRSAASVASQSESLARSTTSGFRSMP